MSPTTDQLVPTQVTLDSPSSMHSEGLARSLPPAPTPEGLPAPPPARDLPDEYGDTKICLLVRDPEWVFAYWEINDGDRARLGIPRSGHGKRLLIRCYKVTGRAWPSEGAHYFFDVDISPYSSNWYIRLPETGQTWVAELAIVDEAGNYTPVCVSNLAASPTGFISDDVDADWMTVEETYLRLYGLTGRAGARGGAGGIGGVGAVGGSEGLARQISRQLQVGLRTGELGLSSAALQGSSEMFTDRNAGAPPKRKDFWLNVHTELVLYGATEPDARVTVAGQPVQLRPDGTFTLRFALPDGEQILRVHATNNDGDMERTITPVVSRKTRND
jgi:hypothetical protein